MAFVTFTSSDSAQECLKQMPANKWAAKNCCRKGKKLKIDGKLVFATEAPDPEDIKWEKWSSLGPSKKLGRLTVVRIPPSSD